MNRFYGKNLCISLKYNFIGYFNIRTFQHRTFVFSIKKHLFFYQILEHSSQNANLLIFCSYPLFMDNGLVTSDGTKVLTVA